MGGSKTNWAVLKMLLGGFFGRKNVTPLFSGACVFANKTDSTSFPNPLGKRLFQIQHSRPWHYHSLDLPNSSCKQISPPLGFRRGAWLTLICPGWNPLKTNMAIAEKSPCLIGNRSSTSGFSIVRLVFSGGMSLWVLFCCWFAIGG